MAFTTILLTASISGGALATGIDREAYLERHPEAKTSGAFSSIVTDMEPPIVSQNKDFVPGPVEYHGEFYRRGLQRRGFPGMSPIHPATGVMSAGTAKEPCDGDVNVLSASKGPYGGEPIVNVAPGSAAMPYGGEPIINVAPGSAVKPYAGEPIVNVAPTAVDEDCEEEYYDDDDCIDDGNDVDHLESVMEEDGDHFEDSPAFHHAFDGGSESESEQFVQQESGADYTAASSLLAAFLAILLI
ncbi:MAG: hypothetical protein SGCHY_002878 [Lobulomycetales sp.]